MGADRLLVCSLCFYYKRFLLICLDRFWNRWEVIGMMDQYVTFGDLLKIGSFLLDLISVILYIYYNHKNSNQNHHGKKKK